MLLNYKTKGEIPLYFNTWKYCFLRELQLRFCVMRSCEFAGVFFLEKTICKLFFQYHVIFSSKVPINWETLALFRRIITCCCLSKKWKYFLRENCPNTASNSEWQHQNHSHSYWTCHHPSIVSEILVFGAIVFMIKLCYYFFFFETVHLPSIERELTTSNWLTLKDESFCVWMHLQLLFSQNKIILQTSKRIEYKKKSNKKKGNKNFMSGKNKKNTKNKQNNKSFFFFFFFYNNLKNANESMVWKWCLSSSEPKNINTHTVTKWCFCPNLSKMTHTHTMQQLHTHTGKKVRAHKKKKKKSNKNIDCCFKYFMFVFFFKIRKLNWHIPM